ncbi:MAG: DUF5683 domain-containing protein [Saprospiraceae bacterium]|nr:DUF5683 domain-containing protein [Saprospiraceae bacterium]
MKGKSITYITILPVIVFWLFIQASGTAQESPIPMDSLSLDSVDIVRKPAPDPKKAALYSLILPGAGQVYNGKWWKAPLVYGALGGMIYLIDYNQENFRRMRTALKLELAGEEHEFTGTSIDNARSLRALRDEFDKNTQLSYIGLFVVYVLNAAEAFVDAHLQSFEISEDLSLNVQPRIEYDQIQGRMQPGIGIGLKINSFRDQPSAKVK